MHLRQLWLRNFRSHRSVEIEWATSVNLIVGANGSGKTNLVESIAFLSTSKSFRGAPTDALITSGTDGATVRGLVDCSARETLVEIDVPVTGRTRLQVNRQRVQRRRDLLEALSVTVFGPDDLDLVKAGPSTRRSFLDDVVVQVRPADELILSDWDRVLRQRNSLLKQVRGRLDADAASTLDVWDAKAAEVGSVLHERRRAVTEQLAPSVRDAYRRVAVGSGVVPEIELALVPGWPAGDFTIDTLRDAREDDLRRGISTIGPHRDELSITLHGLAARTHASQGEQRCLALALRLAAHQLVTERRDDPPVLILDDVFSELDAGRAAALVAALPAGQTFITSATGAPPGVLPDRTITVSPLGVTVDG